MYTGKIYYLKFDKILTTFHFGLQTTWNESSHHNQICTQRTT